MRLVSLAFSVLFLFCVTQAQNKLEICPTVLVAGPKGITKPGTDAVFIADVKGYSSKNLTFSWTVSLGKIVAGENSRRIKIEVPHDIHKDVLKVTVEFRGLPDGCLATASAEGVVDTGTYDVFPIDQYHEVGFQEEKARLDNLAIQVHNTTADMKGYIIKNFGKTTSEQEIKRKIDRIKKFLFTFRKYPKDRFVILVQRADEVSTTLWLWPSDGAIPPY